MAAQNVILGKAPLSVAIDRKLCKLFTRTLTEPPSPGMREISQRIPKGKVIVVGNSGVGKTCLVNSMFEIPWSETSVPTTSVGYSTKTAEGSDGFKIQIEVWDTAGQEEYRSLLPLYFKGTHVALICCDMYSTNSIPEWAEVVLDYCQTAKLLLVMTKTDMLTPEQEDELQEEMKEYGRDYGASTVFPTSARDSVGIHTLFAHIVDRAIENLRESKTQTESQDGVAITTESGQSNCC